MDANSTYLFTNTGTRDLVFFYDTIESENIVTYRDKVQVVGGSAANFKLAVPQRADAYKIIAVLRDDWETDWDALTDVAPVWSTLKFIGDRPVYDAGGTGAYGTALFQFYNTTASIIEIHKDSFTGPVILTLNANENSLLRLDPATYDLYPVSLTVDAGVNGTVVRRNLRDSAQTYTAIADQKSIITINTTNLGTIDQAYLVITNNYANNFKVNNGNNQLSSTLGYQSIDQGWQSEYTLEVDEVSGEREYGLIRLWTNPDTTNLNFTIPAFVAKKGWKTYFTLNADGTYSSAGETQIE